MVAHVQAKKDVSQRRACRTLGVARSTHRYEAKQPTEEEQRLVRRMHELVRRHPRYGYRFITAKLRADQGPTRFARLWVELNSANHVQRG